MSTELSREDKRALRKAEKRKAKFGTDGEDGDPTPGRTKGKAKAESLMSTESLATTVEKEKTKKKRSHAPDADQESEVRVSKKHRKNKDVDATTSAQGPQAAITSSDSVAKVDEPNRKKDRKNKSKTKITPNEGQIQSDPTPELEFSRPSVSFPDPSIDETVPESSSKSLQYAYQYSRRNPSSSKDDEWKFSKARQNWLVRHIWYNEAVPEKYVPLVVYYLGSVKGGSREAIVKGCKIILNPSVPVVAVPVPVTEGAEDGTAGRKVKFASVEEVHTNEGDATASDPAEEQRADIRRSRARLLLDSLGTVTSD